MNSRFTASGFLAAGLFWLAASCFAEQPKVYGSKEPYHQEDYDKMFKMEFDTKTLGDYNNKEFSTRAIEMKAATLPDYAGNLKSVPLTEWQSSKPDFYSKSLSLREFEVKKAIDTWTKPSELESKSGVPLTRSKMDGKESSDSSKRVEKVDLPPPYAIKGEELQNLINHGSEAPPIKVGRGTATKGLQIAPSGEKGK